MSSSSMLHALGTILDLNAPYAYRQVLIVLLRHIDPKTGTCFPSEQTIATKARCEVSVVQKTLKELENDGIISIENGTYRLTFVTPERSSAEDEDYRARWIAAGASIRVPPGTWLMPVEGMYDHLPPSNASLRREERERKMNARYRKGKEK